MLASSWHEEGHALAGIHEQNDDFARFLYEIWQSNLSEEIYMGCRL
jgi:hypothetical protein